MKHTIRDLALMVGQLDQRHIRLTIAVVGLILFVLGAGAPEGDPGPGGGG